MVLLVIASLWKIFVKAGKPGWAAIVPIYNLVVLLEIVGKPIWWIVLFLIPCANIVAAVLVALGLAKSFGKETGFAIGGEWVDANDEIQDARDAEALFGVLEEQVIPLFYDRDEHGLPRRWLAMMKQSIAQLGGRFNTNLMVAEYAERYYVPATRA